MGAEHQIPHQKSSTDDVLLAAAEEVQPAKDDDGALQHCHQRVHFGHKCDKELVGWVGGQTGGQTLLDVQLWYFFPQYELPKTVRVTTLLLLGHVTLLCGKFLFIKGELQLCLLIEVTKCCH